MNIFTATGRLGNDAEVRYIPSGAGICSFSLAVDSGFGDRKTTLWLRCNIWGKQAEGQLPQYLLKGKQVAVSGELSEREWTGKDGEPRKSLELRVASIDLIGSRGDSAAAEHQDTASPQRSAKRPDVELEFGDSGGDRFEDDIPF